MKIHSHKISITDLEMEIIGDALCEAIIKEVRLFSQVTDLDGIKNQLEDELDLLYQLTNIGYKVWVSGKNPLGGHYECGTDVWFDKIYTDAIAEKPVKKVK
jgi:hypothetical protein